MHHHHVYRYRRNYRQLSASQSTITFWSTDIKDPCWVDKYFCLRIEKISEYSFDDIFFDTSLDLFLCHIDRMLWDDTTTASTLKEYVHRIRQSLASCRLDRGTEASHPFSLHSISSQDCARINRQWHKTWRLIARITVHDTLIASTTSIDTLCDIRWLFVQEIDYCTVVPIKIFCVAIISDVEDCFSNNRFVIDICCQL